ncbi:zf-HC2 domain-containing protein [Bailinhaonella thermotolerans]|uniref:Zf-HC2 domain-containing protein n=1 Tax=Bailinhaonella thermotolerans TaxID=1070861 RepID=A0A3A4B9F5_9ACTN|nr:zf-HC2 domain-containing protein [Bailinhaonella thermotolerans]RJL35519.1 zf-HC2 domain-containing protein [Bailinhaonella thermotolerans]
MNRPWHLPEDLIERYVTGRLEPAQVLSVESHLARCEPCRAAVPYEREWLAASWERIEDLVDRPRARPVARLLRRFGVPGHVATLLVATPALARGWLVAVTAVTAFAVAAAHLVGRDPAAAFDGLLPFLVAAPVLPLAGIAVAYGPRVDPVHETQAATPLAGARVLLLRALAVLVTAMALTGAATPLLPGPPGLTTAWLLPALALTATTLALSTWFPPPVSAAVLIVAWLGAVLASTELAGDGLALFSPAAQVVYGLAVAALVPLVYLRRARFDPGESR